MRTRTQVKRLTVEGLRAFYDADFYLAVEKVYKARCIVEKNNLAGTFSSLHRLENSLIDIWEYQKRPFSRNFYSAEYRKDYLRKLVQSCETARTQQGETK